MDADYAVVFIATNFFSLPLTQGKKQQQQQQQQQHLFLNELY